MTTLRNSIKKVSAALFRGSSRSNAIQCEGKSFRVQSGSQGGDARFDELIEISGIKLDKTTYTENFLILKLRDRPSLTVGELDDGFSMFEQALYANISNFPRTWSATLEKAQINEEIAIWVRSERP